MLKIEKDGFVNNKWIYTVEEEGGESTQQKEGTDRTSSHISDSPLLPENLPQGLSGAGGVSYSAKTLWKVLKEDLLQHHFYTGPVPELRIASAYLKENNF